MHLFQLFLKRQAATEQYKCGDFFFFLGEVANIRQTREKLTGFLFRAAFGVVVVLSVCGGVMWVIVLYMVVCVWVCVYESACLCLYVCACVFPIVQVCRRLCLAPAGLSAL